MLAYFHTGDALPWICILPVALVVLIIVLVSQFTGAGTGGDSKENPLSLNTDDEDKR